MLSYAFTFMLIELADSISMVIDGLLVSRHLGPTELAATGLGDTSFMMVSLCCGVLAVGIQSVCSAAMGAGNSKKTSAVFSSGCITAAAVAAVLTALSYLLLRPLCILFGADGSDPLLYQSLYDYLKGWFVGIPGFIGFTVLSPIVTLDGNKKCVTAATVLQSAVNIVGDYLSVTTLNLGTFGVGFFTGFGFDLALVVLILNFLRKRSAFRFSLRMPDLAVLKDVLKVGTPRLTKGACKMLAPLLINRTIIAIGGSSAMAAMAVKSCIGNFCLVAGSGIAESVSLLSQVFYGEKDKQSLQQTAAAALTADVVSGVVFSVILAVAAVPLAGLYLARGSLEHGMAVTMLRMLALSLTIYGVNAAVLSYLQGTRKILPTHMQTVSHRLLFLALCTFVLGRLFGINGLFAAIPISELLVLVTYTIIALISGHGKSTVDSLMLLPDQFGCQPEDSLSFSVTTMEEVVGISEQVNTFCKAHGIDRRRAYYASLCLEELAGNVVDHGFKKDNKTHSCDVRVMIEDDDIVLRIRDDCRYFNLKERYDAMNQTDIAANVGIRLVYGIAKDINYVNLLNTNTLIIRV